MEERKLLSALLAEVPHTIVSGSADIPVTGVTSDNRKITGGEVFVCIAGTVVDGHSFIPQAVAAGASAVVVTKDVEPWAVVGGNPAKFIKMRVLKDA